MDFTNALKATITDKLQENRQEVSQLIAEVCLPFLENGDSKAAERIAAQKLNLEDGRAVLGLGVEQRLRDARSSREHAQEH